MNVYEGEGERIDIRLSKKFSYSRSFFHHIIKRGGVKVNHKVIKKSYYLVINKPKGVLSHPKTVREIHEPSVV